MEERDQSEFNDSIGYLNRLNNLFYICDSSAMDLDGFGWFHGLMCLFRELSTEMNFKEKEECKSYKNKCNMYLKKYMEDKAKGQQQIRSEFYDILNDFEIFLRSITKNSGLQQKLKEKPGDALI